ncbi:T9SS type A sorting domain-containing protein [Lacinutrix himadriensis]|uniref:T9SS type A sorting domain-containing protein n=1 Tax=Lacinutrix himadriensis TaxID=641549 RepID=UPI0006E244F9|nr:T9SS type A sorting domain-containing protein [Lacinutrix himadriensis]
MKKTLLLTAALFVATCTAFAQYTINGTIGATETIAVPDLTGITTTSTGSTNWTTGNPSFYQLRDLDNATTLNGFMEYQLQTSSGSVEATIKFDYKIAKGNSGKLNITIDGVTETVTLTAIEASNAFSAFLEYTFSQTVTISTTPITVKFEFENIIQDQAPDRTAVRAYTVYVTPTATLSTNNIDVQATNITAYPNPVTNSFQINSNKNIESVKLYNITGRLLKTFNEEASYDISDLATGVYVANVKTASGSKAIRIVKK